MELRNIHNQLGKILVAAALLCGAQPAYAKTGSAIAKAVIVSRLSFLNTEELEFGSLLPGTTAGTVTVAPGGGRSKTGGVTLVGGLVQPSRFAGRGTVGQTVLISVNASPSVLTRIGGTETMQLDTLTIGSTPTVVLTTRPQSFTIANATGIFNFPVGGTLRVNARQAAGDYTGTYTLTLNYQ